MQNFYCKGLGLKKTYTLTYGQLSGLKMMGKMPYIDYIEVAPHQYIEFFILLDNKKRKRQILIFMVISIFVLKYLIFMRHGMLLS